MSKTKQHKQQQKKKRKFTLGSWRDLKMGTAMGSSIRNRAVSKATKKQAGWLQDRGKVKSDEWIQERVSKFRVRYVTACIVILGVFILVVVLTGMPLFLTILLPISLTLMMWRGYGWVTGQIEKGREDR